MNTDDTEETEDTADEEDIAIRRFHGQTTLPEPSQFPKEQWRGQDQPTSSAYSPRPSIESTIAISVNPDPTSSTHLKGKSGVRRMLNALRYSWQGLSATFRAEAAFRQEVFLACVMIPMALWIDDLTRIERALMIASVIAVLIVELLNSGLETLVDRVSMDLHPLAGRAKDMGSAAVLLSLLNVAIVWILILTG